MTDHGCSAQSDRGGDRSANRRDDDDLDAYIKEMIENAPPLSRDQRDKLALLLRTPAALDDAASRRPGMVRQTGRH